MPEWAPDLDLDEGLVRSLLGSQFPTLPLDGLRPFAEGWDNALWRLDSDLVFRFPRRAVAVPGVEREMRLLAGLAGELPLPIPEPLFVGRPSADLPWPFFGSRLLPGEELARVGAPDAPMSAEFAARLGGFLRGLHAPSIARAFGDWLPRDPISRADMEVRVPRTRDRLAQLSELGLWDPPMSVDAILGDAATLGSVECSAVVHGDLHVRHVLVDAERLPLAVIDWGDACLADPCVDLALYWSLLDAAGRHAFRAAYGEAALSRERLLRARVLALFLDAILALYAHDTGDDALLRQTLAGLERTLAD